MNFRSAVMVMIKYQQSGWFYQSHFVVYYFLQPSSTFVAQLIIYLFIYCQLALREIYLQQLANQTEFDVYLSDQIKGESLDLFNFQN